MCLINNIIQNYNRHIHINYVFIQYIYIKQEKREEKIKTFLIISNRICILIAAFELQFLVKALKKHNKVVKR